MVVRLRATIEEKVKLKVNCQDVLQSVQHGDESCTTYQSLQSILQVYALCARAKRSVMQWVGERIQEDKLDWYCDYCRVYIHAALSTY